LIQATRLPAIAISAASMLCLALLQLPLTTEVASVVTFQTLILPPLA
jgi:hypothetical protein